MVANCLVRCVLRLPAAALLVVGLFACAPSSAQELKDGKGKPLGRSFRVKLWPTLVFLRDGQVVRQMARPDPAAVAEGFEALGGT